MPPFVEIYLQPGREPETAGIACSGRERDWFHSSFYHCLPLQMANQLGWCLLAPDDFSVRWDGTPGREGLQVRGSAMVFSHFGFGIFSYVPPFVFRTPPGVNLLVKAVPNLPKDGACTLEGLVETDNFRGIFSCNFRLTRPETTISYARGEPLAQILPYPRGWIETFEPRVLTAGARYEEFIADVLRFDETRDRNIQRGEGLASRDWRYFKGLDLDGAPYPDHQQGLPLRPFLPPGGSAAEQP